MAAPDQLAERQIPLAPRAPSIHGHYRGNALDLPGLPRPSGTKKAHRFVHQRDNSKIEGKASVALARTSRWRLRSMT